jgi:hypothetical protein
MFIDVSHEHAASVFRIEDLKVCENRDMAFHRYRLHYSNLYFDLISVFIVFIFVFCLYFVLLCSFLSLSFCFSVFSSIESSKKIICHAIKVPETLVKCSFSSRRYIRGAIQRFQKYINKNYYVLPESYSAPSPSK